MCGNLLPAVRAISSLSRNLLPAVPVAPSGNGETLPVKPAAIWQEEPVNPDSLAYINRWLARKNGGYPVKSEG
jgi:hypothetical protein